MSSKPYNIHDNHSELSYAPMPLVLFSEEYKDLSVNAKVLYSLFISRVSLSKFNGWYDEDGSIFFFFTLEEIMKYLQVSNRLAVKHKKELVNHELLKEVRQGLGKPNKLYLMPLKNTYRNEKTSHQEMTKTIQSISEMMESNLRNDFKCGTDMTKSHRNYIDKSYNNIINRDIDDDIIQNKQVSSDKVEGNNTSSITEKKDPINWELIKTTWNSIRELKPITRITDGRKKKIKTRMKNNAIDQKKLIEVINSINNSDFLKGLVNGWVITFDWLIKNDENFAKVMEGQYQNKGGVKKNGEPTNKYPEYQRAIEESERIARERMLQPIEWEEGEEPF